MAEIFPGRPEEPSSDGTAANGVLRRVLLGGIGSERGETQDLAPDALMIGRDADGGMWEAVGPDGARLYEAGSGETGDTDGGVLV